MEYSGNILDVNKEDKVSTGGVPESDIYEVVVKQAYVQKSKSSKAEAVVLEMVGVDNNWNYRDSMWFKNKLGKSSVKKGDVITPVYGRVSVEEAAIICTGKPLTELAKAKKFVDIFGTSTETIIFPEFAGAKIKICMVRIKENKMSKNPDTGFWDVPVPGIRYETKVDKYLTMENRNAKEEIQNADPVFSETWLSVKQGVDQIAKGFDENLANSTAPLESASSVLDDDDDEFEEF